MAQTVFRSVHHRIFVFSTFHNRAIDFSSVYFFITIVVSLFRLFTIVLSCFRYFRPVCLSRGPYRDTVLYKCHFGILLHGIASQMTACLFLSIITRLNLAFIWINSFNIKLYSKSVSNAGVKSNIHFLHISDWVFCHFHRC